MTARIAVLHGGLSLERDVSVRSGHRVADALEEAGHEVVSIDIDSRLVERLVGERLDLAYLTLHGKAGEDGAIQGLLDLLGLPYTGPDATASALAWDKPVAKALFRRAGLATPDSLTVSSDAVRDLGAGAALDHVLKALGPGVVVKPAQGGAAMGVRRVDAPGDLPVALVTAFGFHGVALVERFVAGTEVAVSVVDGVPLPPVEIQPKGGQYDFSARYTSGATEFFAPARLPEPVLQRCQEAAVAACDAIGARHVSRADLIVDEGGTPMLLELDTCPGMTDTSLLPLAAEAQGWTFVELCSRIAAAALQGR